MPLLMLLFENAQWGEVKHMLSFSRMGKRIFFPLIMKDLGDDDDDDDDVIDNGGCAQQ